MAEPQTGMPKADMKRLINMAKKEPVNCAIGLSSDAKLALLMLDKNKAPRALEKLLTAAVPGAKNLRWGTAVVDPGDDPKLVKLTLNSGVSGMAAKLVKTLKGTGITKVVLVLEDGTEIERHAGEEEQDGEADEEGAPASAPPDQGRLHQDLTDLVKRMMPVIAAEPARKDVLAGLAGQAQTHIKAGNAVEAAAAIEQLKQALGSAGAPPPANSEAKPPPADTAAAAGAVTYAKSRLAWLAVRRKIETDLEKLRAEIVATYQDQAANIQSELDTSYRTKTAPVLAALDEELADRLDEATNETDPTKRQALIAAARQAIARYQAFVAQDKVIADLDANPFVPLTIGATLGATLNTLAAAVR